VLGFLAAGENLAFVIALGTMVLIGLVEAVGLGSSALGHDLDLDADGDWLGWLGFGRLPLLMLLVVFLACFSVIGLVGQQIALSSFGALLPGWIAIPAAGVAALPATGGMARIIGAIMPRDETTAIGIDQLVGLHAQIVVGTATQGSPAKARVRDFHGQVHHVMVEPDIASARFAEGAEVLLVRREDHLFRAISSDRPPFSEWIER
jgi:hypothetical protein